MCDSPLRTISLGSCIPLYTNYVNFAKGTNLKKLLIVCLVGCIIFQIFSFPSHSWPWFTKSGMHLPRSALTVALALLLALTNEM